MFTLDSLPPSPLPLSLSPSPSLPILSLTDSLSFHRVFRTMFNVGQSRMSSPQGRRRINSSSTGNLISNCHSPRLAHKSFPSPTKSRLIHAVSSRKKKATSVDGNSSPRAASVSPELQQSPSPFLDEPRHIISEQVRHSFFTGLYKIVCNFLINIIYTNFSSL